MAVKDVLTKNGVLYLWTKIKALMDNKVDKVVGKGLSTNDLTDELKQKILNAGDSTFDGQYASLVGKPSINSVELNGNKTLTELGIAAKSAIPTKLSQLNNDSGYQTAGDVTTAITGKADKTSVSALETTVASKADKTHSHNKAEITDFPTKLSQFTNDNNYQTSSQVSSAIANAVGKITSFETKVVTQLPSSGVKGTIYLVASSKASTNQAYDEYIWVNSKWEFIGTTAVDLTGYLKTTDLVEISNSDIDNIFATV